jgi:hypothetical protein
VDRWILKVPVVGQIMHNSAIARFARTTAVTFKAGVPLVEALGIVAGATGNSVYEKAVLRMRDDVSVGYPVNMAMKQVNLFPHMVIQMTAIGEEAGALDTMLFKVAEYYEQEVNNAVDALSSLLEPMIMVVHGRTGRRHGHRHVPADLQTGIGGRLRHGISRPAPRPRLPRRRRLGLLLGSFLNVVILRLPKRMEWQWKRDAREILEEPDLYEPAPPGIVVEPSHCPHCKHKLSWYENIPLFSWLALRGKCRHCRRRSPSSTRWSNC